MKPEIDIYNPDQLGAPLGLYKHMTRVKADEFLFIAGQLAADKSGASVGRGDFETQMRQVFVNIEAALQSADAGWDNVVRFTTYLVHSQRNNVPEFRESGNDVPVGAMAWVRSTEALWCFNEATASSTLIRQRP